MRRRVFLGTLLLLAAVPLAGCSAPKPKADLLYQVSGVDGSPASDDQVRRVENELDTRLQGAGYDRRQVKSMPGGKVRISLPEAVGGKIPEITKMLEAGDYWKEIKVRISLVSGGGE